MGAGYLLDTNTIIGYLDNKLPAPAMLFMHGVIDAIPNISVITKIELLRFNVEDNTYKILSQAVL